MLRICICGNIVKNNLDKLIELVNKCFYMGTIFRVYCKEKCLTLMAFWAF